MGNSERRGIIRKTDDLGRVVIPIELRKKLNIKKNDPVEIMIIGDQIVLKKPVDSCIKCGEVVSESSKKLDLNLCNDCIESVALKINQIKLNK